MSSKRREHPRKETAKAEPLTFDPPPELEEGADVIAERYPVLPLPPPVDAPPNKRHCPQCGSRAKHSRYGVHPDGACYYHRCKRCTHEWKEIR